MAAITGKYERKIQKPKGGCPYILIPISFFLVEVFAVVYLQPADGFISRDLWPLAFAGLWAVLLGGFLRLLPNIAARLLYIVSYGLIVVYSVGQTGYYLLFSEMMWFSEFRYVSEGVRYVEVLTSYPLSWFVWVAGMLILGVLPAVKYPRYSSAVLPRAAGILLVALAVLGLNRLPRSVFEHDSNIRYAQSDYGRMQSAEAAYVNMFNPHRLYQVCGMYQTMAKDIYQNTVFPMTPGHARAQEEARITIEDYFADTDPDGQTNVMTGALKDKNVVLVLMESIDDWMIGTHTPTISRLMEEGIHFTNFYTPPYGGIRTFNTEFCINTGSYLSSQGGYAFDYVTNNFSQSLASLLKERGYSAKVFHYNDPSFYSRDVFSEAMGFEDYVCYGDYLTEYDEKQKKQLLYDELLLFQEPDLRQVFFREAEKTFDFVITRSAHLSYKYNEVLSHWALKRYPEYRGMTGNEETDCALVKARLVDDFFAQLLAELEKEGKLEDTVVIGITDHYTYGYKDMPSLYALSGTEEKLLLEKTPCFIWSMDLSPMKVEKVLSTSDFLPTVLNLMGVETDYDYIGRDAFDESYEGYALFSDGSWITKHYAYDASGKKILDLTGAGKGLPQAYQEQMSDLAETFITVNNLILETDYYKQDG